MDAILRQLTVGVRLPSASKGSGSKAAEQTAASGSLRPSTAPSWVPDSSVLRPAARAVEPTASALDYFSVHGSGGHAKRSRDAGVKSGTSSAVAPASSAGAVPKRPRVASAASGIKNEDDDEAASLGGAAHHREAIASSDDSDGDDAGAILFAGKSGARVTSSSVGKEKAKHSSGAAAGGAGKAALSAAERAAAAAVEEMRAFRKTVGIVVDGADVPPALPSFDALPPVDAAAAGAATSAGAVEFQRTMMRALLTTAPLTACLRKAISRAPPAAAAPEAAGARSSGSAASGKKGKDAAKGSSALAAGSSASAGTASAATSAPALRVDVAGYTAAVTARAAQVRGCILANVEASKFKEPTPIQMQALPVLLAGRDMMGIAPTGSGKTAAFALPLLAALQGHDAAGTALGGPRALVLTPTKELASQTLREVTRLAQGTSVRAALLTRASITGAATHRVAVTEEAGDLVRRKPAAGSRRRRVGGAGSDRRAAAAADMDDDDDEGEVDEGEVDEASEEEDEGEEEAADSEESGSGSEADEDDESEPEPDDDDDDAVAAAATSRGAGAGAAAAASAPSASVVAPALPHCDILIATPLMLVAALRHARRAAGGSAAGASVAGKAATKGKRAAGARGGAGASADSDGGDESGASEGSSEGEDGEDGGVAVILPCLRFLVLDEADKLLELGFLEQVDEIISAARFSEAQLATYVRGHPAAAAAALRAAGVAEELTADASSASAAARSGAAASAPAEVAESAAVPVMLTALGLPIDAAAGAAAAGSSANGASSAATPSAPSTASTAASASALALRRTRLVVGLFSATMPQGIEELALAVLRDPLRVMVGGRGAGGAAASSVKQKLLFVGREDGKLLAIRQMVTEGLRPPALIFVQSKERALQLHKALLFEGLNADAIHADKSPAQREEAVTRFRRGETSFLIATDVLGRGMDFKAVRVVINYDFPTSAVSYIHRVGRTGRGGRTGEAVTLFTEDDIPMLRSIANVMRLSGCDVPEWMLQLKKMPRAERKRLDRSAPHRRDIFRETTRFDESQAYKARVAKRAARDGAAGAASAGEAGGARGREDGGSGAAAGGAGGAGRERSHSHGRSDARGGKGAWKGKGEGKGHRDGASASKGGRSKSGSARRAHDGDD